ncbi:hypothetical protein ACWGCW_03260 [Streptomyces sp. NPDC054933]
MSQPQLPSTEAAVVAILETAAAHGREARVTHDIGADHSARRTAAGAFAVADPDGSLPHEAYVEIPGSPEVAIEVYSEGDVKIAIDGVEFHDIPRDSAPAFLTAVYTDRAFVKLTFLPPHQQLIVPLPGDETYKEVITRSGFTPWLSARAR